MSGCGGGSSFQIFSDSSINSENQNAVMRKTKRDEVSGKPPATKRAALGEISNNTRVQPLRAVKQDKTTDGLAGTGVENAAVNKGQKFQFSAQTSSNIGQAGSFKIHVDNKAPTVPVVPKPSVAATIASSVSAAPAVSQNVAPRRGLQLRSSVTRLSPMEPIVIDDDDEASPNSQDSPMLLDMSRSPTHDDIKKKNLDEVLAVPEYTEAIYTHLRETEGRHHPGPYMKKQQDINCNMRNILVDWLVEVAEEYKLHRETLMLSVNYIDRFLSKMSVNRKKLQLVGAAAMFLAAKYEEIYPPEVSEFVYITDNTYTKEEVLKMEHLILKVLTFDVNVPTVNLFCERYCKDAGYTEEDPEYCLTMMLAELTMLDSNTYLQFLPSRIAATCLLLANHTLGVTPAWPSHMVSTTRYTTGELTSCVQALFHTYSQAPSHPQQACYDKYKQAKLKEVSLIPPPKVMPVECLGAQS